MRHCQYCQSPMPKGRWSNQDYASKKFCDLECRRKHEHMVRNNQNNRIHPAINKFLYGKVA